MVAAVAVRCECGLVLTAENVSSLCGNTTEGLACCVDQFMLGDDVLVAPVLEKGMRRRAVRLPAGRWKFADGTVYDGGQTITADSPLHVLPYFEKCGK